MENRKSTFTKEYHQTLTNIKERKVKVDDKGKLMKIDYPLRFIISVVNEFQGGKECGGDSFITPPSLFIIIKTFHIQ